MATPDEVLQYLQQLEPILTRWYNAGQEGEIATIFGRNELQAEERPKKTTVKVRLKRPLVGARAVEKAG